MSSIEFLRSTASLAKGCNNVTLREDGLEACPLPIDHVRHVASLAQAALLKKFGKSDVCDFFAEIDFRHGSRFRR
jgi:hypothetical protein